MVEIFLERRFVPTQCVYDPFVGSGTTLVEANVYGADAIGSDNPAPTPSSAVSRQRATTSAHWS